MLGTMNITRKACLILLTSLCFASSLLPVGAAGVKPQQNSRLKPFYSKLSTLFLRHYPKVTSHMLGERIHFEQETQVFIVHELLKGGEWQDREVRGPKMGGILCDIEMRKGKYEGAAELPQTSDKRYFRVLGMAPYSAKHNAYLYIHLSYPGNVKDDFLKQFTELVNGWENYLD